MGRTPCRPRTPPHRPQARASPTSPIHCYSPTPRPRSPTGLASAWTHIVRAHDRSAVGARSPLPGNPVFLRPPKECLPVRYWAGGSDDQHVTRAGSRGSSEGRSPFDGGLGVSPSTSLGGWVGRTQDAPPILQTTAAGAAAPSPAGRDRAARTAALPCTQAGSRAPSPP